VKLLVAAHRSELVAFPESLDGFDILVTGVGKTRAAVELTRALERGTYDEIVVVGTAGKLDPSVGRGVHEIGATFQHDTTDLAGVVAQHVSMPARITLQRDGLTIATGDSFIDDPAAVAKIVALGAHLVDMETYVLAFVAQEYGVPIRVLRAISDDAQDGATEEWDVTVAACSAELREWLRAEYAV